MLAKYLGDYYTLKIKMEDILEKENISQTKFYSLLKKENMLPRRKYYGMIDLGDEELNRMLRDKYASIVKRCTGKAGAHSVKAYKDMEYMPIYRWAEFCLRNKDAILELWEAYQASGKNINLAISIDRIDESKGYVEENLEFVTYEYNSWKHKFRPIKVATFDKEYYFFSAEEASRYFDLRRQYIGELLRGVKNSVAYTVTPSTVDEVLKHNNVNSLKEYYQTVFN